MGWGPIAVISVLSQELMDRSMQDVTMKALLGREIDTL
jgi:hypothetical protein